MSIWFLRANTKKRLALSTDLDWFERRFRAKPMAKDWKPPEIEIYPKSYPAGDFVSWMIMAPVVSHKAMICLKPLLDKHCEFLPLIELKGQQYYAINVLTLCDIVDESKSDILYSEQDGHILNVHVYAFHKTKVDAPLFKVPRFLGDVFVTRPFVDAVIQYGLRGAAFADPTVDQLKRLMSGGALNVVEGVLE